MINYGKLLYVISIAFFNFYNVVTESKDSLSCKGKESKILKKIFCSTFQAIRHGLGVRIAGSHPAGPGSIPGVGTHFCGMKVNKLFLFGKIF